MSRKLFTAASALSLLLCLATVALWARTYTAQDRYQSMDHSGAGQPWRISILFVQTYRGRIWVGKTEMGTIPRPTQGLNYFKYNDEMMSMEIQWREHPRGLRSTPPQDLPPFPGMWCGFRYYPSDPSTGIAADSLILPLWSLVLVFLILPLVWIVAAMRSRRNTNTCNTCAYDLTGNTSGTCPECGTAVSTKAGT